MNHCFFVIKQLYQRFKHPIRVNKNRDAVLEARSSKGVVIGLSRSALRAFPISEGDCGDDFRVQTGLQGLSIDFLTVIRPLGHGEQEFFNSLQ